MEQPTSTPAAPEAATTTAQSTTTAQPTTEAATTSTAAPAEATSTSSTTPKPLEATASPPSSSTSTPSSAPPQPTLVTPTTIPYSADPALLAAAMQQQQLAASLNKPFGAVKLFIGQIPKTMTEPYLRPLFAPFGTLVEVAIIRNRATGESRGCAFVTYDNADSAELAIDTLHNKQTLPGMSCPIQVKYAHGSGGGGLQERPAAAFPDLTQALGEGMTEFKLFIGMLPRTTNEDALRAVFQPYGKIVEVVVLREPDGSSRGCGFVKYERREDALNAINACNGQMFFQGQTNPLTVKFADGGRRSAASNQDAALMAQLKAQQLQIQMLMAQQYGQYGATVDQMNMLTSMAMGRPSGVSNQTQGPPGANLFIYHLPTQYSDADLLTLFSPFGQILSVKVFIDKATMVSKGFGFVSYASADSARLAIEHMDGLQVGEKRLKVQLKKSRGAPY